MKLQTVQDKGNVINVIAAAFNDDDVLCYILNVETTETSTKKTKLIRRYQEVYLYLLIRSNSICL